MVAKIRSPISFHTHTLMNSRDAPDHPSPFRPR
jgi:hypothetical protein